MNRLRRLPGLLRSTPVRLALGLTLLFSGVSVVTLGFAYFQIRGSIEETIAANLDQQVSEFRMATTLDALAVQVTTESIAADPENRVFALLTPSGASFGNARAEISDNEVRLLDNESGRPLGDDGYISRVVPMAGGVLVVAESQGPISDLKETFLRMIGFSLIPTILLSLGAAILIALASARRVRRIESTLDRLTGGDFSARVAETGRSDDLARIGSGLDRMATAQEASNAALRQVSSDIAHDLKTPVQRISVLLNDLRDRLPEASPEAAIAERAMVEAARAVAVFQSLLQIAQIEGGGTKARFAPVDLADLVRTFAEIYEPAAEETGHGVRVSAVPESPVLISGEKTLLGQVIANLIENALRHTPPGSRIDLALMCHPGHVVLTVADTGPGIPSSEREKVLRRLYRLEHSRTTPGNGLGLSLVAAIADLHGATLAFEDNQPGLRVSVSFPRQSAHLARM